MFAEGQVRSRVTLSFIMGAICIVLGGSPLLNLPFVSQFPQVFSPFVIKIALLVGGLMLLYDGLQIKNPMTGMVKGTAIIAGLVMAIIGALPLLIDFGWLNSYLPFIATLTISVQILEGVLAFFGLYLLYDGFMLSRQVF